MNKPAPFSDNQFEYFQRCRVCWLNVAEGGKRGGKNVVQTLAQCVQIETHPNKLHLAAGVDMAAAKLNILDCDGFGMLNYFEGRYREGEYKNRDCLYVKTAVGERIILVAGGGKDGDFKRIKGNTYGTANVTESNECHHAFLKEVMDRTLSSGRRWIGHDLNPKDPGHKYYKDFLDFHEAQQKLDPNYGFNYGHFTIADNMSIPEEDLRTALNTYDKNSIWYQRDIKGIRMAAEGIIYSVFANNLDAYLIDTAPKVQFSIIAIDPGDSGSAHAFNCTGYEPGLRSVATLDDYNSKASGKDIAKLAEKRGVVEETILVEEFVDFVKKQIAAGYNPIEIRIDSAAQMLKRSITGALLRAGIGIPVTNAIKGKIAGRISFYGLLFSARRYKIMRHCKPTIDALRSAVWDPKNPGERLDNYTTNIDNVDAQEYTTEPFQKEMTDIIMLGGK